MTIHEKVMRKASLILFWVAIFMFVLGFAVPLVQSMPAANPYGPSESLGFRDILTSLHTGVSSAILPFIGSAIVWSMQDGKVGAK